MSKKPLHEVVRDLDFASRKGMLTPSFIEEYSRRFEESEMALYALATRNLLPINIEEGRNDHILNEWDSTINVDNVMKALDEESKEVWRKHREARADGRPAALRKSAEKHKAFKVVAIVPSALETVPSHRCGVDCAH